MKASEYIDMVQHIKKQNLRALQDLLNGGADPNWSNGKPLMEAAAEGWMPGIEALLTAGAKATIRNSLALMLAVRNNHANAVVRLMRAGIDPLDNNGQAIAAAIETRNEKFLDLLLRAKRPALRPEHHKTLTNLLNDALLAQFGVHQLLNIGAKYDHDRMYDATCKVLQEGKTEIVEQLLKAGLNPNYEPPVTGIDFQPHLLTVACYHRTAPMDRLQIVRMLIAAGARDTSGDALRAAEAIGDHQLVNLVAGAAGKQN